MSNHYDGAPRTLELARSIGKRGIDWHHSATLMSELCAEIERELLELKAGLAKAGSAGGKVKSWKKSVAARRNGAKGGRPVKKKVDQSPADA